ncbi:hypothetical protein BGZ46_001317, partial [Entomortierella lignicola]
MDFRSLQNIPLRPYEDSTIEFEVMVITKACLQAQMTRLLFTLVEALKKNVIPGITVDVVVEGIIGFWS